MQPHSEDWSRRSRSPNAILAYRLTTRGKQAVLRHERIRRIRCAPKRAPCPTCGRRAYRKRVLHRRLRTLAYHCIAWLEVTYAEYQARCRCRKFFRTWPLDVPQKADYDAAFR